MEKEIDQEKLASCDGSEGRPTYISAGGRVIDVSASPLWKGGTHMARHHAGRDLTADIEAAPHGTEVLDRYPQVGVLRQGSAPAPNVPALVAALLVRYPMLRRHPHPAAVHFPIVFSLCASFFSLLYVLTGRGSFDQTAFYCLIGALITTPVGILTGLLTWRINYLTKPMRPVSIKKAVSFPMAGVLVVLTAWRGWMPGVLEDLAGAGLVYLVLVLALAPAVLTVAYYGGMLTFPAEKGKT
jgi:predicted heme/steroid binding protein/uncharacterized membrane protein